MHFRAVVQLAIYEIIARGKKRGAVERDELIGLLCGDGFEEIVFVAPVIDGQNRGEAWTRFGGLGFEERDVVARGLWIEGVHGAIAGVGDNVEIARLVEEKIHGVERIIANDRKLRSGDVPLVDGLLARIHEVEVAIRIDGAARDVEESAGKFFYFGARLNDSRVLRGCGLRRFAGNGEPGKFALAKIV